MTTQVQKIDVKQFIASNNITGVNPVVLKNINGYPYICFQKQDGTTENIYFSKNAAQTVNAGDKISREFFAKFQLVETTNAQNETRLKFSSLASIDVDDLF